MQATSMLLILIVPLRDVCNVLLICACGLMDCKALASAADLSLLAIGTD